MKLVTKSEWDALSPRAKGYILYAQAELEGSELKGLENPYPAGSYEHIWFTQGESEAAIEAQDSEE